MTWTATKLSTERREAIARAARAVARLAADPQVKQAAYRLNGVVNGVCAYTDAEAWDAVATLEDMVRNRGLATNAQIEADRRACRFTAPAEPDPMQRECEECGARPGQDCGPFCTGQDQDRAE